jgi:hypothetical protein
MVQYVPPAIGKVEIKENSLGRAEELKQKLSQVVRFLDFRVFGSRARRQYGNITEEGMIV